MSTETTASHTADTPQYLTIPPSVKNHSAWKDWTRYHRLNRHVMRSIVSELERARSAGRMKASVKAIINYLRWNMYVLGDGSDIYAINDKYTGIYTHIIAATFPQYRDMIDKRELRAVKKK